MSWRFTEPGPVAQGDSSRPPLLAPLAPGEAREYGFEPYVDAEGAIALRNCPFDAPAERSRNLFCATMNVSFIEGVPRGWGNPLVVAVLTHTKHLLRPTCSRPSTFTGIALDRDRRARGFTPSRLAV